MLSKSKSSLPLTVLRGFFRLLKHGSAQYISVNDVQPSKIPQTPLKKGGYVPLFLRGARASVWYSLSGGQGGGGWGGLGIGRRGFSNSPHHPITPSPHQRHRIFRLLDWISRGEQAKKLVLLFVAGSFLSLSVSACTQTQSASSTATPASDRGGSPQATPGSDPKKQTVVRIGYINTGLGGMVKERGTLERGLASQNIQIKWVGPYPSFAPVLETINANVSDLGAGGDIAGLSALSGGIPACIIAYRPANPQAEAIVVHADSPIRTFNDLVGKKVIVNRGGISEHLLLKLLEKENIPKDKVNRVYMKPDEALPAWAQRHVDAWAVWEPWVSTAELKYGARQIPLPSTVLHYSVYMVRRDSLAEKPEAIKAVLAVLAKEAEWFNQQSTDVVELYQKVARVSPEVAKKNFERRPVDGVLPLEPRVIADLQNAADWLYEQKVIKNPVDVNSALCPGAESPKSRY